MSNTLSASYTSDSFLAASYLSADYARCALVSTPPSISSFRLWGLAVSDTEFMEEYSLISCITCDIFLLFNKNTTTATMTITSTTTMPIMKGQVLIYPSFQKEIGLQIVQTHTSSCYIIPSFSSFIPLCQKYLTLHSALVLNTKLVTPIYLSSFAQHTIQGLIMTTLPISTPSSLALMNIFLQNSSLSRLPSSQQFTSLSKYNTVNTFLPTKAIILSNSQIYLTSTFGQGSILYSTRGHASNQYAQRASQYAYRVVEYKYISLQFVVGDTRSVCFIVTFFMVFADVLSASVDSNCQIETEYERMPSNLSRSNRVFFQDQYTRSTSYGLIDNEENIYLGSNFCIILTELPSQSQTVSPFLLQSTPKVPFSNGYTLQNCS